MKFSIIVPVYNTGRHLARCIAALEAQDYPRGDYEILMVDNNSTDGSPEILASARGIRVFREPKQGSYAARNRALREARGEYLAFTDSDCMPVPGWLRAIETAFQDPTLEVVLGPRRPAVDHWLGRLLADFEVRKNELVFASKRAAVYNGFTNNMGVRRSTWEAHGPFEERARGGDTIFVRRMVSVSGCDAVGYRQEMVVRHAELDGATTYWKKMYAYGRSRALYRPIFVTEPLSWGERLQALRACRNPGQGPWQDVWPLVGVLAVGGVFWKFGALSGRWTQRAGR